MEYVILLNLLNILCWREYVLFPDLKDEAQKFHIIPVVFLR